jgi:hypothetical protein
MLGVWLLARCSTLRQPLAHLVLDNRLEGAWKLPLPECSHRYLPCQRLGRQEASLVQQVPRHAVQPAGEVMHPVPYRKKTIA